jgi:hypothetical protein
MHNCTGVVCSVHCAAKSPTELVGPGKRAVPYLLMAHRTTLVHEVLDAHSHYGATSSVSSCTPCSSSTQTLTSPSSPVLRITSSPSFPSLSARAAQTT